MTQKFGGWSLIAEKLEKRSIGGSVDFEDFWNLYPRKMVKKPAKLLWDRMTDQERIAAIEAIPNHVAMWEAEGREAQFIPHARTWLFQGRWEDQIEIVREKAPPKSAVAWWASDEGITAKGRELGIHAKGGESMAQYKARVVDAARRAA